MSSHPYDPTLKTLVESSPEDWPVFVGQPRAPTEVIDADVATVSGAADKVLCVRAAEPYLLHLEFQSGHDAATLPGRLHVRNSLLEYRHDLPVRTVAVLLHASADSPALTGERRRGFAGAEPYTVFRYQVVRVWQLSPDRLLRGGVGTLPLAPISAVTESDLPGIIERMQARLARRGARRRAPEVWAAASLLMGLRYPADLIELLLRRVGSMRESSIYQALRAEALTEGEAKGAISEARKLLLLLGGNRFGPPSNRATAALDKVGDLGQLEALIQRYQSAQSWEELLDLPARGRRRTSS